MASLDLLHGWYDFSSDHFWNWFFREGGEMFKSVSQGEKLIKKSKIDIALLWLYRHRMLTDVTLLLKDYDFEFYPNWSNVGQ